MLNLCDVSRRISTESGVPGAAEKFFQCLESKIESLLSNIHVKRPFSRKEPSKELENAGVYFAPYYFGDTGTPVFHPSDGHPLYAIFVQGQNA